VDHGGRTGVLLLQLGTPDAPTPEALKRYLREFLWDRRVVDLSRALWWPILNFQVLRTRPARSAHLYQKVWTTEGSPLAVITNAQVAGLTQALAAGGIHNVQVAAGMRYGNPSQASVAETLLREGCDRLLAVPMYPQYAGATTGSSLERLFSDLAPRRVVPPIRVVPPYYADSGYIGALAATVREAIAGDEPDHVLISFHGLPKRYAEEGDPYPEHCAATARALSAELGWPGDRVSVTFQSRFGREEWLKPYTDETLVQLAARRYRRLLVLCPGFTADCLETIEEMGITNRGLYEKAGGGEYRLVPCLNDHPAWISALHALVLRELQGWVP
jgi:ferrochelatase